MIRTQSLWVATSDGRRYPRLDRDIHVDAVVVGAGIAGVCAAYQLEQDGLHVALIDAGRVGDGVTGFTTAKVTVGHGLIYNMLVENAGEEHAKAYGDANLWGIDWIEGVGIDCDLRRVEMQVFAENPHEADLVRKELEVAQRLGLPASWSDGPDLPIPTEGAIRYDRQLQFHPRKFVSGLAAKLRGPVYEHTKATDVQDGEPCRVTTEHGVISANYVVVASHYPFYDPARYYMRLAPYRDYAIAVRIVGAMPSGMSIGVSESSKAFRCHGDLLIISGESHKVGQDPNTQQRYASLEDYAREHFQVNEVAYRWSAQDNMTPDQMPYIGWIDDESRHVLVSTGFCEWGMAAGAYGGRIISDLVSGRENPWAECFKEHRLKGTEGVRTLISEGANVAKRFVGDKLTDTSDLELSEIGRGQAAVIKIDGEKVAVFRDHQGTFHTVSPICTHMGCDVAWNAAEQSWDCPCHGSRFDPDGHVLHGPALTPLESKKV